MAISQKIRDLYKVTIGIETHVQLSTKTKLFSAVGNDAREAKPNTLISHIDLGMPGALPVLNQGAVELGIKAAFALGTSPQKFSKFDRKHYFYPDLPLGYQITQFYDPIIKGGRVSYILEGEEKTVEITEAHLEADAGKSTHPEGKDYSLVDLNRAGTPLLEIVSAPDIHSPAEAKAYATELHLLMRYAGVSDANLYYGNMRFDVNVSVSKTDTLGTRTESKNLNSFKAVEKAAEYEINRQIELLEKGDVVVQETRGWDDAKQKTFSQRSKEEAHDYRYMPDPDLPPVELSDDEIDFTRKQMPKMPNQYRDNWSKIGLDESVVGAVLNNPSVAITLGEIAERYKPDVVKRIFNWFASIPGEDLDVEAVESGFVGPRRLVELSQMVGDKKLNSTGAKEVFLALFDPETKGQFPEQIAAEKNLIQDNNEDTISAIVADVIKENSAAAEDVKNGEMKAIGFLVGQVMKASKGKANPGLAQDLIKKQLGL